MSRPPPSPMPAHSSELGSDPERGSRAAGLGERKPRSLTKAAAGVFVLLLGSSCFYWQDRDWNCSSRLMLAYALVDRGTLTIDGLQTQTNDAALYRGHFYTDKQPGFSFLAAPIYAFLRGAMHYPAHPLDHEALRHWPADYWITLVTSGLATALCGALLVCIAGRLGCGPLTAILVGLAYGLCTPAYVYATLAYGHQVGATMLLGSFVLVSSERKATILRAALAGLLASYAATIDLSLGPVSAIVGSVVLGRVAEKRWPASALAVFAAGAFVPLMFLLAYNTSAFGSPWEIGYAHHIVLRFREIHRRGNPLGLHPIAWQLVPALLFGRYRGLLIFSPIVALAPLGWAVLFARRLWVYGLATLAACLAVFLVNLSYPEWTGGWCTGPRLLVPMLPFAMVAVAAAIGLTTPSWSRWLSCLALVLALVGGSINLGCIGVGGRIPDKVHGQPLVNPMAEFVWPQWRGDPIPAWWGGGRFAWNLVSLGWPKVNDPDVVPAQWQWIQFGPLVTLQVIGVTLLVTWLRPIGDCKPR